MKRHRRLRCLVPDPELVRRRAAGETLRELAVTYGVSHSTLGRYFSRPQVVEQLRDAGRLERREAATRRLAQRQLEREMRSMANQQVMQADKDRERFARNLVTARPRPSPYAAWLDEHETRRPERRGELQSRNDLRAGQVVAEGGGIQAIIEATGLRTLENVTRLIDPVILAAAFDNDARAQTASEPPQDRLRRFVPDAELLQRRAGGQTLRQIAADYGVAHTTVCRYLRRPEVARRLKADRCALTKTD